MALHAGLNKLKGKFIFAIHILGVYLNECCRQKRSNAISLQSI
jgi:hypothetical protein